MEIKLPELVIVALIGPSGSGKSHFAHQHFPAAEIISQDHFSQLTGYEGSDEGLHAATLELMYKTIEIRLQYRKSCVVDATLLSQKDRAELRRLARKYHVKLAALVFETPLDTCAERNMDRGKGLSKADIRQQLHVMEQTIGVIKEEGIKTVYRIAPDTAPIVLRRFKAASDMRDVAGPFDIIGDVHGCREELLILLEQLGYVVTHAHRDQPRIGIHHPKGRRLIFVGDLCDRGPDSPGVLRLVMDAVSQGAAYCVPGNHDDKLLRKLNGNPVQLRHGLEKTMAQLEGASSEFLEEIQQFVQGMSSHLEFDGGNLVVAHAGIKAPMHGRSSAEIHSFCLYGETTGESDEFGLPVRQNWAGDYGGKALVVYGHTPIPEPLWQNNTVNIDTGCVFGGELTALRYPERTTVAVAARQIWSEPMRPMHWTKDKKSSEWADHSIDTNWTSPKMLVSTSDGYNLNLDDGSYWTLATQMAVGSVHLRWLIYAPPSMSPPTTSSLPGLLEHPAQALDYYRKKGLSLLAARPLVGGTKVVIVLCRDAAAAGRRFGLKGQGIGCVYTRSARPYFADKATEQQFLQSMADRLEAADLWSHLHSDWLCLEAVAAPLSAKAPAFIPELYAEVSSAANHGLQLASARLAAAQQRGLPVAASLQRVATGQRMIQEFQSTYRQSAASATVTWHPLQTVALEGQMLIDKSQLVQQQVLLQICGALGEPFVPPVMREVDLDSENSMRELTAWWEEMNAQRQPGILVYPMEMPLDKQSEMMQAAIQVRCKEHLRLLFGPAYDSPESLELLRARNLRLKRETAVREFSLAKEATKRFVAGQEFGAVFSCIFTVLGLELRMIDARL